MNFFSKKDCWWLFFLVMPMGVIAQIPALQAEIKTENFSLRQGLSNSTVNSITKDAQGFIWIGTQNGINRFDGYDFLPFYKQADSLFYIHTGEVNSIYSNKNNELFLSNIAEESQELFNTITGETRMLQADKDGFDGYPIKTIQWAGNFYTTIRKNWKDKIYRYNSQQKKFELFMPGFSGKPPGVDEHFDFLIEKDNTCWLAYITQDALVVYHVNTKGVVLKKYEGIHDFIPASQPPFNFDKLTGKAQPIGLDFHLSKTGQIFISVKGYGFYYLDKQANLFRTLPLPKDGFFNIAEDTLGNVLAYDEGIEAGPKTAWLIRPSLQMVDYSAAVAGMPKLNAVYSDDFASWLLVGGNDGLRRIWLKPRLFTNYLTNNINGVPGLNSMRGIGPDGNGNILFVSETSGLYALTPAGNIIRPGDAAPGLKELNSLLYARNVLHSGDSIVMIGHAGGFTTYFPKQKVLQHYKEIDNIRAMVADENGVIWLLVDSNQKLFSFNPRNKRLRQYLNKDGSNRLLGFQTEFLFYNKKGVLWAGTNKGIIKIETAKAQSHFCSIDSKNNTSVICISEDKNGTLWLGTLSRGLQSFNPSSEKITAIYGRNDGLANESIASILPDNKGNFWLGTYSGLSFFNRTTYTFVNFFDTDGLPSNEFNRHAFFRDTTTDIFYFGGMNGVTAFHEDDIIKESLNTPVLIAYASYMQDNGQTKKENWLGLTNGATIELPAESRWLSLKLSLASYENPAGNQFSYKVEGIDNDWHFMGNDRNVNFTHLPSGKYTLRLKGTTSRRDWPAQEYTLLLNVHDFWYNQWWLKLLLAAIAGLAVYFYYRYLLSRRLATQETKRLAELDAFKTRFFTNITHEFRTPLTVILGTTGQIEDVVANNGNTPAAGFAKHVGLIKRSGESLLRLINQILDLSRLENSSLPIRYIQGDVVGFVRYVADGLNTIASTHGVKMEVQSEEDAFFMDYDPDRLLQVVYNLISNAIKFTPSGGAVVITIARQADSRVAIIVKDSGSGIPEEDLPNIFERFYQAKNQEAANTGGTGIGLSFVRELLKAMDGSITVQSKKGEGSEFTVLLPFTQNAHLSLLKPTPLQPEQLSYQQENTTEEDAQTEIQLPQVLVIEDNPDVVELLANSLQGLYNMHFAYNGEAGIEKAFDLIPDIIISDVMMPGKDGFEVLEALKNDVRTSHIPVVMLTARATIADRVAGLKRGADAYLAKPFHHGELLAVLTNLLAVRKKLQLRYASYTNPQIEKPSPALEPKELLPQFEEKQESHEEKQKVPNIWLDGELLIEDSFIQELHAYVTERLDMADLSVEQVSQAMGMSQSVLYRKLTALTGQSLVPFIRTIRLQKAKMLLLQTSKPISEVAYETGFNDAKFFSKVFLQEFGVRPKAFRAGAEVK